MTDQVFNPSVVKPAIVQTEEEPAPKEQVFNPAIIGQPKPQAPEIIPILELGQIKTWSFSALKDFEACAYRAYLKSIAKLPQPESEHLKRGNEMHALCEQVIKGEIDEIPKSLKNVAARLRMYQESYPAGNVICEDQWAHDHNWNVTEWFGNDTWLRLKLDAMILEDETSAILSDWKTGRRFGNELKHSEQLMLYAIISFLRYPKLEFIKVENQYIDGHPVLEKSYTRALAMNFLRSWHDRAMRMTTADKFPPLPSKQNCRYCPYRAEKDGGAGGCDYYETNL